MQENTSNILPLQTWYQTYWSLLEVIPVPVEHLASKPFLGTEMKGGVREHYRTTLMAIGIPSVTAPFPHAYKFTKPHPSLKSSILHGALGSLDLLELLPLALISGVSNQGSLTARNWSGGGKHGQDRDGTRFGRGFDTAWVDSITWEVFSSQNHPVIL